MSGASGFLDPTLGQSYRYHFDWSRFSDPQRFGPVALIQIGRLYCNGGDRIGLHPNLTALELTVVTRGRGVTEINGERIPLKRGDVHLTFPGDLHAIESDENEPLEYDFISLWAGDGELLPLFEETVQICKNSGISMIHNQWISELLSAAIGEINSPDEWSDSVLEGIFRQIVFTVFRDVRRGGAPKSLNVSGADAMCYRIMHYIDTHIYSMHSLSELAEAMNYNYSYLSDLFRSVSGGTLQEYHRDRKLERAKLLIGEGMPIREVAELLQYSSVYTFSRAFRERYGIPPRTYRQQCSDEASSK